MEAGGVEAVLEILRVHTCKSPNSDVRCGKLHEAVCRVLRAFANPGPQLGRYSSFTRQLVAKSLPLIAEALTHEVACVIYDCLTRVVHSIMKMIFLNFLETSVLLFDLISKNHLRSTLR